MKSPPWVREEIVLALELYVRGNHRVPDEDDPAVILLSRHLSQMSIHLRSVRAPSFRNPNGVAMKIANLRAFDPHNPGKGMTRGSRLDKEIVDEFIDDPRRLYRAAADIRLRFGLGSSQSDAREEGARRLAAEPPPAYITALNTLAVHERMEQDMNTQAARKAEAASLACEVCGFDFGHAYGDRGAGYIHFHHRAPLESLSEATRPAPADLHLVCANCHAMLHASGEPITVAELKTIVRDVQRRGIRDLANRVKQPE